MPPKVRITREEIIQSALELVRAEGKEAVNARAVANALGCSTQPVFSNFSTMEELEAAVNMAAYEHYLAFLRREVEGGKYPPYKAFGMAYVRFAKEEKALFHLLFLCDRRGQALYPTTDFEESVNMIMQAGGITEEQARLLHLEMWTCVHGIGTIMATSFLDLDWELVSTMLSDVYHGLMARYGTEG